MSAPSQRSIGRCTVAALGRVAFVLTTLVASARGAAAQFLEFRPYPPSQANGSVPVTLAFGGTVGANGGCNGRDEYGCADPYYYPYDDAVSPSMLSFTVNGGDQTAALSASGPVDDNCWYGDYGTYQCTRTYTVSGSALLAPDQVNTLTAASPYYGLSQTAYVSATAGPMVTLVSPTLYHDPALCAQACGELVQTYTTPGYVSRDVAHSLTLVYRSGRARPLPVVELDVVQVPDTPTPDHISLQLFDGNNTAVSLTTGGTVAARHFDAGVTNRLAAQVVIGGVVSLTAVVRAYDAAGTVQGTTTVPVVVLVDGINGQASPYGVGWGVAGVQRWGWQAEGAVLVDGDGSIGLWRTGATSGPVTQFVSPPGDFTQVAWDANAGILTRRYPDGTVVRFDGSGAMISSTDPLGNATTFSYRDQWKVRLSAVTDPAGQSIRLYYRTLDIVQQGWQANSLSLIQDPTGRSAWFGVNTNNDLLVNGDYDALGWGRYYDGEHRVWQTVDKRSGTWNYTYSASGELQSVTAPAITAANGTTQRPTTQLTGWGQAVIANAAAAALHADTVRAAVTGPDGSTVRYQIDRWGAAARVEAPGGVVVTAMRDTLGRVTQTVDARGGVTTYRWNPSTPFLLDSVDAPTARVGTAFTYDAATGYAPQQTRVNGQETVYRTYRNGRLVSVRSGGTGQPATSYDYTGRLASDPRPAKVTDPRGHVTTYTYEAGGLQNGQSATDAAGTATVLHDALGRDSVAIDPLGHRTLAVYDVLNRPTAVTDANGHTTRTAYDPLGAATVTDAVGQQYRDSVNALGLPFFSYDPGGAASGTAYDAAGRVAAVTNRRGQTVRFGYDPTLGTLTSLATPDGADATYGADALGRVRWAQNAESVDSVFADALGRDTLAVHRLPALAGYRYTVQSLYDSLGRRTRAWYRRFQDGVPYVVGANSNQTTYTYGSAGELASINGAQLAYNNEFAPTSILYPSRYFAVTRGYTDQHTLAAQHFSSTAENVLAATFSYDSLNRITARFSPDMNRRTVYTYDAAGQLANAWTQSGYSQNCTPHYGAGAVPGDSAATWTCTGPYSPAAPPTPDLAWDAVGNPGRNDVYVTPGTGNRLEWANGHHHDFDADGNVVQRFKPNVGPLQRFTWNALGQLAAVWNNPDPATGTGLADSVTFGYDAGGRRVRKTDVTTGATTYFVWDGADLAADVDASGGTSAMYTYFPGGPDQPFSVQLPATGQPYYYVTEPPGHVTGLVDYAGAAVATYRYSPFGVELSAAGGSGTGAWVNRLKYGAREYDAETGLYYNRARYYDPKLQRFLSPDPIGLAGGVNWYAYTGNDPVNARDPTGLDTYCSRGDGQNWGNATVGGQNYTVTVGGALTCYDTPDFHFDPADEYYGNGFTFPTSYAAVGSGRAAPSAPPNHPLSRGDAVLLDVGRRLTPAQPILEAIGALATAPLFGEEEAGVLLTRQLGSEELLSQATRGLGARMFRGAQIRDLPRLLALYGGEAEDWLKMTTGSRTVGRFEMQIHWYRNAAMNLNVEFKTNLISKGWWWP